MTDGDLGRRHSCTTVTTVLLLFGNSRVIVTHMPTMDMITLGHPVLRNVII